jgi:hypothetical protein
LQLPSSVFASVLVTTSAVAVWAAGGGTVVMTMVCLRYRRLRNDAIPAAQAPVHTAMTTMVILTPTRQSSTSTAMIILAIAALEIPVDVPTE